MIVMTNLYIAVGLCGFLDHQYVPVIGNSILKFMPSIRSQTIVKTCVAVNVMFFHRELNLESTLLWASSINVAKVKSNNKKCQTSPSTVSYSPITVAGLSAFTKILFTFCSFFVNIAVTLPVTNNVHVIVGLIGYLGNACNMLIYPYIVELCLTHALHGMSTRPYVIAKDVCFVLLGLSVFACGTSALVLRLVYGDS
ncbi:uncharacterized protein LOC111037320 [Myzus persicae]|uniref:uncharacterized protein LOC111037320 n=1 Tax=Myzus persicae TaxID=13164 RepID=UPI000B9311E5|nr:uncharacterized protein LOC111037320 [Myzus persicae]